MYAIRSYYGAMHDVTEGGVLQAVWELCRASECGAIINIDKIPVLDETKKLCNALCIDPLRLISSGCMVIAVKDGQSCVNELHKNGIPAAIIGKIRNNFV